MGLYSPDRGQNRGSEAGNGATELDCDGDVMRQIGVRVRTTNAPNERTNRVQCAGIMRLRAEDVDVDADWAANVDVDK